jgi:putative ABC transport system substrate-binding protein
VKRREFITLVAGATTAWSLDARAQQPAMPLVGYLHAGFSQGNRLQVTRFEEGLREAGFIAGQNVAIEYRWAEGRYERLPDIAAELVARNVAVLATGTPVAALAAKNTTRTVPIVFVVGSDPIANGLVASLARPGGNITGATFFSNLLTAKRFALQKEIVPRATLFGALVNPNNANQRFQTEEAERAAGSLATQLVLAHAGSESDLVGAFDRFKQRGAEALIVLSDSVLNGLGSRIARLAVGHGLPTCFAYRSPTEAGGLMSYGTEGGNSNAAHQAGGYVGRILKGERPGDLPVQQPTKFEFVINLKTAKALGLEIPPTLLARADEVIE